MSKQFLQDISFIIQDLNSTSFDISLLYHHLTQQFRNQHKSKKLFSENFNLIHTLTHKDINGLYDVKTNKNFIFIASSQSQRVNVFHRLTRKHHSNIEIQVANCTTIGLDQNNENDLYIAGLNHKYIYLYHYNNKLSIYEFIKKFDLDLSWVTNIVIDKNLIYCVERYQNKILILNKQDGKLIREIKNKYTQEPWSMTLCDKDYFFVSSLKSKSIAKFSLNDVKLIKSYEEVNGPAGMIINDKTNHLLVCSYGLKKILVFDKDSLTLIKEFTHQFDGILTADIDCDGNLYISDNHSKQVKIFN